MKKRLFVLSLTLIGVSACSAVNEPTTEATPEEEFQLPIAEDGCILPLETFAYNVNADTGNPIPGVNVHVFPLPPWQVETNLPSLSDDVRMLSYLSATRTINGNREIWILRKNVSSDLDPDQEIYHFAVYQPDLRTWKLIPAEVDGENIHVSSLYVLPDGSLWGKNEGQIPPGPDPLYPPLFSKFNEVTERFELVEETKGIPVFDSKGNRSKIVLGVDGVFWILMSDDAIYSYNPMTTEIQSHVEIPDFNVYDAAIDAQNNLFVSYFDGYGNLMADMALYQYSSETGEFTEILLGKLEPYPSFQNLYVDHSGRLWLGGVAWREPNGDVYQILPSPVFVTNVFYMVGMLRWQPPYVLMESSDGRLWFRSDNGLVWADPLAGDWCWFTTEQSNIVEDEDHVLWLIADGKLYKYDLTR